MLSVAIPIDPLARSKLNLATHLNLQRLTVGRQAIDNTFATISFAVNQLSSFLMPNYT
jgi:hypothetical protein